MDGYGDPLVGEVSLLPGDVLLDGVMPGVVALENPALDDSGLLICSLYAHLKL